ncbi:Anillin, partial [Frankliniella fusca]
MSSSTRFRGRKLQEFNVQRRLHQWEHAEQNAANYGYFQKVNFMTNQHQMWEKFDPSSSRLSKLKEEERRRRLALRREKLANLIHQENEKYSKELKEYDQYRRSNNNYNIGALRQLNGELKRREEEKRAREAELRLYHRWRNDQPLLKHVADRNHTVFVKQAWVDQVEERLAQEKKQAEEEKVLEEKRQSHLALQEQAERAFIEERNAHLTQVKHTLQCQLDILMKKEELAEELKKQEELMFKREKELEELAERRRLAQTKRGGLELGMYFQEHYNLKLKRRAREIQESLEEDQRILKEAESRLADPNLDEDYRKEARKHIDRANAILTSYAAVEKLIEKDARVMFQEEARFFWDKQEKRWKEEQEARSKLMADTLATLQLQVQERAQQNRLAQESLLREREDLLRQIENGNTEMERLEAEIISKKNLKSSLEAQSEDETLARLNQIRQQEKERQVRLEEMKKEEERLLQEFKRLNTQYPKNPLVTTVVMPSSSEIEKEIRKRAERRKQDLMEAMEGGILGQSNLPHADKVSPSWTDKKQKSSIWDKENQSPTHRLSQNLYPAKPARSVYTSPLIKSTRPTLWKSSPATNYTDLKSPGRNCLLNGSPTSTDEDSKKLTSQKTVFQVQMSPSAPPLTDSLKKTMTTISSMTAFSATRDQRLYPSLPRSDANGELKSPKDFKDYTNRSTASALKSDGLNLALQTQNDGVKNDVTYSKASFLSAKAMFQSLEDTSVDDIEDSYDMDKFLEEALGSALQLNSTMTDEMTDFSNEDSFHSIESYRNPLSLTMTSTLPSPMRLVKLSSPTGQISNVNDLVKEAEIQQQLMGQASKALTLCRSSKNFSSSASLVDAERLLLLSTLRHKAVLEEIKGVVPSSPGNPEFRGKLRVLEVTAPLKEDSLKWCKTENDKNLWFLCVLCYGHQILASKAVAFEPGSKCVIFSGILELSELPSSFDASLQIYLLRTFKPQLSVHKSRISKAYQMLQRKRKSCLESAGSEQLLHMRNPAFALNGSVSLDLPLVINSQPVNLNLEKVPLMSPLRGNLWIKFETSLTSSVQLSGFLTILEKAGGSHAWQRRWCHLSDLQLRFWNYPTDQDEKVPLEIIDLKCCSSDKIGPAPRHLCARNRTLMLETTRTCDPHDMNSTLMECKIDYTVV